MKLLLSLLLIIFLAGCSESIVAGLVEKGGVLYQDDFSDPKSGWARSTDASGSMDYGPNATYQLSILSPGYDLWSVSGHTFEDVRVEVEASRVEGPDENRYGLVCRYADPQNFYFFVISSDGYQAIGKVRRGVQTLLGQDMMEYSPAVVNGDGPNQLRFDCTGDQLSGYVNQQAVAQVEDKDLTLGDAGLIAGSFDVSGVKIRFDNFVVYKP